MAKKLKVNEGDWICSDKSCGNINFSWRAKCNKCGKDKGKVDTFRKTGAEIGKSAAGKSGGLFSSEDWQCSMCGNVNWARRTECNVCKHPKYNRIEARTGLGGGYCERENVEYIEREESDDEIDEFGRKKKKFRKRSDNQDKKKEQEEDDDDESVDLSKYELEDSDAEGDSDVDLSKYDLSASDTEDNQGGQKSDNGSIPAAGTVVGLSKESSSPTERRRSRSCSKDRRRSRSSSRERRHSRSRSPRHRRRSRSRSWSRSPRRQHRRSNRSRSRSRERRRSHSRERRRSYRSRSRSRERHY